MLYMQLIKQIQMEKRETFGTEKILNHKKYLQTIKKHEMHT